MTIGTIDINEKDTAKVNAQIIQLTERENHISDYIYTLLDDPDAATARTTLGITAGATVGTGTPGGRLTLATATPVMTSTQSAKTTIYYTPYISGFVPLYDGSSFTNTAFTELSAATTDTTKSPAAIGASKINDWFVWSDSGTLRLSHGPDWTSDTARSAGTALVMVNGLLLNNASITNGPAASRGTYVGTMRSAGDSKIYWQLGSAASGGGNAALWVWNCYNRVLVATSVIDSGAQYTYSSATTRTARAGSMQVYFVLGLQEDGVVATYVTEAVTAASTGAYGYYGLALDSMSGFSQQPVRAYAAVAGQFVTASTASAVYSPAIGVHFVSANELGDGVTATIFAFESTQTLGVLLRM